LYKNLATVPINLTPALKTIINHNIILLMNPNKVIIKLRNILTTAPTAHNNVNNQDKIQIKKEKNFTINEQNQMIQWPILIIKGEVYPNITTGNNIGTKKGAVYK
jgi:hypothetical protein